MKEKGSRKRLIIGVIIGYFIIMLMGYLGISFYYSSHFIEGSKINGIDCSNKTADEVKEMVSDSVNEYTLKVEERDGSSETIMAPQIKLVYVDDSAVDDLLKKQKNFSWPTSFAKKKSYEMTASISFDDDALESVMDNMSCFQEENIEAAKDAYIAKTDSGFEIESEVMGTTLDRDKVKTTITEAINAGKTSVNLEDEGCYEDPEVLSTSQSLTNTLDSLNKMTETQITYTFGSRSELLDGSTIINWIMEDSDGNYSLDTDQVSQYVAQLSQTYDTFGMEHEFTTTGGETITLSAGGDYGWCINKTATTDALVEAIKQGTVESREPVYTYTAMDREENDIGSTYVEISLEQQKLWLYVDGELTVETDIVSGGSGHETPSGCVWSINAKREDAVVSSEDYSSPVKYWIPFNGDVGLHDADTWRSNYGGTEYETNGTNGSIDVPDSYMEQIYNAVEVGTPVIVY